MGTQIFAPLAAWTVLLPAALSPPLVASTPPRAVAFVVGVQTYTNESDLNRLQFTVKDARDVFDRIGKITNLHTERSQLLLADSTAPEDGDPSDPKYVFRRPKVSDSDIRDRFRIFLGNIRDEDTVFVYLGGHGTEQRSQVGGQKRSEALFLASDFVREPRNGYIRLSYFRNEIEQKLGEDTAKNVRVVFFANMCGAGSGVGAMSAETDLDTEFSRSMVRDGSWGFARFAFFPATAPGRDTHEKEELGGGRSIFAHHLLTALGGAAGTDGEIFSGPLFIYLNERIEGNLPRNVNFDEAIRLGVTGMEEGALELALATSLLGIAVDDLDQPSSPSRLSYAMLARHHFSQAGAKNYELRAFSKYREAQALSLTTESLRSVEQLIAAAKDDPNAPSDLRATIDDLRGDRSDGERFASLSELSRYLREGGPFLALQVFTSDDHPATEFASVVQGFPGLRAYQAVRLPPGATEAPEAVLAIEEIVAEWELASSATDHLLLFFDITALVDNDRLFPFGPDEYRRIINAWPGSVTLIYVGPFGGFLTGNENLAVDRLSLFLGAREREGMTFSGPYDTGTLVLEALLEGVDELESWPPFKEYKANFSDFGRSGPGRPGPSDWVVGTPHWISSNPAGRSLSDRLRADLKYVGRWGALAAYGCNPTSLATCWEDVNRDDLVDITDPSNREGNADLGPFLSLKVAATNDLRGLPTRARVDYGDFVAKIERLLANPIAQDAALSADVVERLRQVVGKLVSRVEERRAGLGAELRVRLASVAVNDYSSPLIADLLQSRAEIDRWQNVLQKKFGDRLEVVPPLTDPTTANEISEYLENAFSTAEANELILFVYSGRGFEWEGRRYMVAGGASELRRDSPLARAVALPFPNGGVNLNPWDPAALLDLSDVAALAEGKWLVAIYDTQFTQPLYEPIRVDALLDKHIDSVRPATPPDLDSTNTSRRIEARNTPRMSKARFIPSGGLPSNQVHVWWDGRLTELRSLDDNCRDDELPPFASALSLTLARSAFGSVTTYRDWAKSAQSDPCHLVTGQYGALAVQGDVDSAFLATGEAAEQISYFVTPLERADLNLRAALVLAGELHSRFGTPLSALSRAAILIRLNQFYIGAPEPLRDPDEIGRWLAEALGLLEGLDAQHLESSELRSIHLQLFARALAISDRGDEARTLLLSSIVDLAADPATIELLIDLTEMAIAREPASIVRMARDKIEKALAALGDRELVARWSSVVSQVTLANQGYRIEERRDSVSSPR